ncbi:axonemal dynein light chain [Kipferlia bialata]|uniref:Axonemal dynein light chain n=1 Tax=Kipferlia bialata TaxID=797122 RepID=A0A9K3CQW4_9EUKA|nr:axonemal dynein light chain [Kipferlia bialata]|eukprot:g1481.t1
MSNSLVKFEPPVLVGEDKGRVAQSGTNLATEDILNSILPPREFEQGGQTWRQAVSTTPATRLDVINLQERLDRELKRRQAREVGLCPIREEMYSQTFDEIIRQVTINCAERGVLLMRVRDELRMTIQAYQTLYESGVAFGVRKALSEEMGLEELREEVLSDLSKGRYRQAAESLDAMARIHLSSGDLEQALDHHSMDMRPQYSRGAVRMVSCLYQSVTEGSLPYSPAYLVQDAYRRVSVSIGFGSLSLSRRGELLLSLLRLSLLMGGDRQRGAWGVMGQYTQTLTRVLEKEGVEGKERERETEEEERDALVSLRAEMATLHASSLGLAGYLAEGAAVYRTISQWPTTPSEDKGHALMACARLMLQLGSYEDAASTLDECASLEWSGAVPGFREACQASVQEMVQSDSSLDTSVHSALFNPSDISTALDTLDAHLKGGVSGAPRVFTHLMILTELLETVIQDGYTGTYLRCRLSAVYARVAEITDSLSQNSRCLIGSPKESLDIIVECEKQAVAHYDSLPSVGKASSLDSVLRCLRHCLVARLRDGQSAARDPSQSTTTTGASTAVHPYRIYRVVSCRDHMVLDRLGSIEYRSKGGKRRAKSQGSLPDAHTVYSDTAYLLGSTSSSTPKILGVGVVDIDYTSILSIYSDTLSQLEHLQSAGDIDATAPSVKAVLVYRRGEGEGEDADTNWWYHALRTMRSDLIHALSLCQPKGETDDAVEPWLQTLAKDDSAMRTQILHMLNRINTLQPMATLLTEGASDITLGSMAPEYMVGRVLGSKGHKLDMSTLDFGFVSTVQAIKRRGWVPSQSMEHYTVTPRPQPVPIIGDGHAPSVIGTIGTPTSPAVSVGEERESPSQQPSSPSISPSPAAPSPSPPPLPKEGVSSTDGESDTQVHSVARQTPPDVEMASDSHTGSPSLLPHQSPAVTDPGSTGSDATMRISSSACTVGATDISSVHTDPESDTVYKDTESGDVVAQVGGATFLLSSSDCDRLAGTEASTIDTIDRGSPVVDAIPSSVVPGSSEVSEAEGGSERESEDNDPDPELSMVQATQSEGETHGEMVAVGGEGGDGDAEKSHPSVSEAQGAVSDAVSDVMPPPVKRGMVETEREREGEGEGEGELVSTANPVTDHLPSVDASTHMSDDEGDNASQTGVTTNTVPGPVSLSLSSCIHTLDSAFYAKLHDMGVTCLKITHCSLSVRIAPLPPTLTRLEVSQCGLDMRDISTLILCAPPTLSELVLEGVAASTPSLADPLPLTYSGIKELPYPSTCLRLSVLCLDDSLLGPLSAVALRRLVSIEHLSMQRCTHSLRVLSHLLPNSVTSTCDLTLSEESDLAYFWSTTEGREKLINLEQSRLDRVRDVRRAHFLREIDGCDGLGKCTVVHSAPNNDHVAAGIAASPTNASGIAAASAATPTHPYTNQSTPVKGKS